MNKLRIVCATAALAATGSGTAFAETTANVGFMSDYIFRGVYQAESVPFAGIDIASDSGFYMGTWGANLKDGLEYDIYLGYQGGGDRFQWYVGATGYYYTDEFDNSYEEANIGFSFGFLSVDYAIGQYEYKPENITVPPAEAEWDQTWDSKQTYEYLGATFSPEVGPYYFIGRTDYHNIGRNTVPGDGNPWTRVYGTGADGYWFEIGKSFEIIPDLELNVAALYSGDVPQPPSTSPASVKLAPGDSNAEYAVTVTLTKTIRMGN